MSALVDNCHWERFTPFLCDLKFVSMLSTGNNFGHRVTFTGKESQCLNKLLSVKKGGHHFLNIDLLNYMNKR